MPDVLLWKQEKDDDGEEYDYEWDSQWNPNLAHPDDGVMDGSGGEGLLVWTSSRHRQLRSLATATFENLSSFSLPAGMVDTKGFDGDNDDTDSEPTSEHGNQMEDGESLMGTTVSGTAVAPDGEPISGDAIIQNDDGEILASTFASQSYLVSSPPPESVTAGTDMAVGSLHFRFAPSFAGVHFTENDISFAGSTVDVLYGGVEGTVTDVDGNPVEDSSIIGEGASTVTDEDGEYSIVTPGGTDTTLLGIDQSREKSFTAEEGEFREVNWTFPALEVVVQDPQGIPVSGAPVIVNGREYETNSNGIARVDRARMGEHLVIVMDEFIATPDVDTEGVTTTVTLGESAADFEDSDGDPVDGLSSIRVDASDISTGGGIRNLDVDLPDVGVESHTTEEGEATLLVPDSGELLCRMGPEDQRYKTQRFRVVVEDGETTELESTFETFTQTVNH